MRVKSLLHKLLSSVIHNKQAQVLSEVVETVLQAKTLSVTQVGRRMINLCKTRSNIRKVDRLYSNHNISGTRTTVYRALVKWFIKDKHPLLLIDGSKLPNSDFYSLRASVARSGRGMTVYEAIYDISVQGSSPFYQQFLNGLAAVLGKDCQPILVTDAEFQVPWFKQVQAKGWEVVGRVRGNSYADLSDTKHFVPIKQLYQRASRKPAAWGHGYLTKESALAGYFYCYKEQPKGRHAHTRSGRHSDTEKSKRYTRSAQEPWLLYSSLDKPANYIVNAYRLRMTIEENFRDSKSGRYGLGLKLTYSKSRHRYTMMLLVAMIAQAIAYLVGTIGEMKQIQYQFQANSIKTHRVLSRFYLGCEMLYRNIPILYQDLIEAIKLTAQEIELTLEKG